MVPAATELSLDLRSVSRSVLGAPLVSQRVDNKFQILKGPKQGGLTGKGLQSKSVISRGHGRNLPTSTAP